MGVTTDFLRCRLVGWLIYVALPLLPCCLLLALYDIPNRDKGILNGLCTILMGVNFELGQGFFSSQALLFALAVSIVLWTVHALMRTDQLPPDGKGRRERMRPVLVQMLPKVAVLFCAVYVALRLVIDSSITLLLILMTLPLALLPPTWLLHDGQKGVKMRYVDIALSQWVNTVAVMVTLGFVVFLLRGVMQLPAILLENSADVLTRLDEKPEAWFRFLQYLSRALSWWAFFLGYSILVIAAAYLYGNGVERTDETSLAEEINRFEQL